MTLTELIEELTALAEDYGDVDPEVRIMEQEEYPFECKLEAIVTLEQIHEVQEEDPKKPDTFQPATKYGWSRGPKVEKAIYLIVGPQLGYGTKTAWQV